MRNEDYEKAKKLIAETKLLTSIEKAEWLQLLPEMGDRQIADFLAILMASRVPMPKTSPAQQQPVPAQRPAYELELPEHASTSAPAPAPAPAAKTAPAYPPSAFQQRQSQPYTAPQSRPQNVPIPPVAKPSPFAHQDQPLAPYKPKQVVLQTAQDFANLTPEIFHDQDAQQIADNIFRAAVEVSKLGSPFAVLEALRRSPLNQTYLQLGTEMLQSQSANSDLAFDQYRAKAEANNADYLTRREFEAFADLRARLDSTYL